MRVYGGMFLVALCTLTFEISLSRLLSVVTWYHIGFFAISVAMLGMTAGAITVFLAKTLFKEDRLLMDLGMASYALALCIPVAIFAVCNIPLSFSFIGSQFYRDLYNIFRITIAVSLPFYFSGIVVSALLTRVSMPVERLYASDLLGAALGCLIALIGLSVMDTPSCALLSGFIALVAAQFFRNKDRNIFLPILFISIFAFGTIYYTSTNGTIRPKIVKGSVEDPKNLVVERWNSFSRIRVKAKKIEPGQIWDGPREFIKDTKIEQHAMDIDGLAETSIRKFSTFADIEHLKYDITNMAYYLRPTGGAAVIGVGGAKDIQAALLFGHENVTGIEINHIFIDLLQNEFADFAGVGKNEKVRLIVDEARSYLSHSSEQFQVLQMSLIDTWASTAAGAFSLSENSLYTMEAWTTFIKRLAPEGIYTVSRWFNANDIGETGRMMSLAVATLIQGGVQNPNDHIALVTGKRIATLLLSKSPLSQQDIATIYEVANKNNYKVMIAPGQNIEHPVLADIMRAHTIADLEEVSMHADYNISPSVDQSPYFFNMLKLKNLGSFFDGTLNTDGVIKGNLTATFSLICLIAVLAVLTVLTIVLPLIVYQKRSSTPIELSWSSGVYFASIGAGFMCLEIGLLQRLSIFLGHPVYALGILLFGIIASTGLGSWLSKRWNLENRANALALSIGTAITIIIAEAGVNIVIDTFITYSMTIKIATSIFLILPLGLLLGCFFPCGMKIARANNEEQTPWYWALNGIFGVLFSALAVFVSIYLSISVNFYLAAGFYMLTSFCLLTMIRGSQSLSMQPLGINEL